MASENVRHTVKNTLHSACDGKVRPHIDELVNFIPQLQVGLNIS